MKRMNGKSIVGSVLALSLVLAGTGYAYWTDTLSVNAKATTGEFGVAFTDLGLYAQYNNETLKGGWSIVDGVKHGDKDGFVADNFFMRGNKDYNIIAKDGTIEQYHKEAAGFNNIEFDAKLKDGKELKKGPGCYVNAKALGSDTIELSIQKMYPGYAQAFRTDIVNVGDIAAKLSDIKFDVKAGNNVGNLEDMIGLALLVEGEQYNPKVNPNGWNIFKLAANVDQNKVFKVGGVEFVRLSALKDADFVKQLENSKAMLCAPATDNRMDLFLGVAMDPDAEGVYTTGTSAKMTDKDDAESQNKEINVAIKLLWDQFNVGKDVGNPNILKKQNH